jgi:hypothetical protein
MRLSSIFKKIGGVGWGGGGVVMVVGSTALCGHTNFVFGLKLGCDNSLTLSFIL